MDEAGYKKAVNQPGAFQVFEVDTVDTPAAAHKGSVTLTRRYYFRGRTGVSYANLAVNANYVVKERKWGVRRDRWFVDHTPKGSTVAKVYATVFAVRGSFGGFRYFVNGEPATREFYNSFRTASAAKPKSWPRGGYFDFELSTITPVVHTPEVIVATEPTPEDVAAEAAEAAEIAAAASAA